MPIPEQELKVRTSESVGVYGGGEGGVELVVDFLLDGARELEVVIDVFYAGFVEGEVGSSELEEVAWG